MGVGQQDLTFSNKPLAIAGIGSSGDLSIGADYFHCSSLTVSNSLSVFWTGNSITQGPSETFGVGWKFTTYVFNFVAKKSLNRFAR